MTEATRGSGRELPFLSFPASPWNNFSLGEKWAWEAIIYHQINCQEERYNLFLPDLPFSKQTSTSKDNLTPCGFNADQLNNKTIKPPIWRTGRGKQLGSWWPGEAGWVHLELKPGLQATQTRWETTCSLQGGQSTGVSFSMDWTHFK